MELLLQRRAKDKVPFGGLWSNTCCTNMRPGDEYMPRAVERLYEEMGISLPKEKLKKLYSFSYEVDDPENVGWCENELDTVIVGEWDGKVVCNPAEVSGYKWVGWNVLKHGIESSTGGYSPWVKLIVNDKRFRDFMGEVGAYV